MPDWYRDISKSNTLKVTSTPYQLDESICKVNVRSSITLCLSVKSLWPNCGWRTAPYSYDVCLFFWRCAEWPYLSLNLKHSLSWSAGLPDSWFLVSLGCCNYTADPVNKIVINASTHIIHKGNVWKVYWRIYASLGLNESIKWFDSLRPRGVMRRYVPGSISVLAPVPLSIFRSNSKFDESSERSSFEYTGLITTIVCTRHDSDTVVTCAKYRCDRPRIFYTRVSWFFIEFRIRSKYA